MNSFAPQRYSLVELARRSSSGIEVVLFWDRVSNEVTVCVGDDSQGLYFEVNPPRDRALDCFNHPFIYAPADLFDDDSCFGPVFADRSHRDAGEFDVGDEAEVGQRDGGPADPPAWPGD
jgi:hypothetical protein